MEVGDNLELLMCMDTIGPTRPCCGQNKMEGGRMDRSKSCILKLGHQPMEVSPQLTCGRK